MIYLTEAEVATLPEGQQRAVLALVGDEERVPTYNEAAEIAGIHVGTLRRYLRRIRERHPSIYKLTYMVRRMQLGVRHKEALERADEHSHKYHKAMRRQHKQILGYSDNQLVEMMRRY